MNWRCLIGFHKWVRLGGASNVGSGKFKITLVCEICRKTDSIIK